MSVGHSLGRVDRPVRRQFGAGHVRRWALFAQRPAVIGYVIGVEAIALMIVVSTAMLDPVRIADVGRFAALAGGAVLHQEAVRHIERLREQAVGSGLLTNLRSLWIFAAALTLPPPLVYGLTALVYLHVWLRGGSGSIYRRVFTASTMILAPAAAMAVLSWDRAGAYPLVPHGLTGLLLVVAAGSVFWLVNFALVVGAVILSDPERSAREALGDPSDQLVVAAALGLGVAVTALLAWEPWLLTVLMITVVALHRALLLPHFRQAARTDSKTGLLSAGFWHEMAQTTVARAIRTGRPVAVLMIDLDLFKGVNDRVGHLAGDQVIRAVAHELRREARPVDLVGRFGGEEFVVLFTSVGSDEVTVVAERLRQRIATLEVPVACRGESPAVVSGLSVSIGVAVSPHDGNTVDRLLLAADSALFEAKESGRNQVRLASVDAS